VTGLQQAVLLAPGDGSLGPLLRLADDRLAPRTGYGRHEHRAVDVVAVVLAGALRHTWGDGALLGPGDVAVLRAGAGLEHDEVAGHDGARVLQAYLRSADPGAAPAHEVHRGPSGWVELGRPDARLWVHQADAGEQVDLPPGLLVVAGEAGAVVDRQPGPAFRATGRATVLVWQLETTRPAWAD
jgi:quercetin 2,3-dioxygenase